MDICLDDQAEGLSLHLAHLLKYVLEFGLLLLGQLRFP